MAIQISTKARRVSIGTEQIRRAAAQDPEVRRELEREYRLTLGRRMARLVGEHYSEALNQAARIVDMGVPDADKGRNVTIKTAYGNVFVGFWGALTAHYRRRKERERPGTEGLFWKLTGKTSRFLFRIATQERLTIAQLRDVKAKPAKGGKSKTTVLITSAINLPSTGDATIDGLVRNSFVRGAPAHVEVAGGKTLSPAGIVAVTESRRPLLSKLAAALGTKARQALGNL